MDYLYVLRCENNKWYIGKTKDVMKRYNEHVAGRGSDWTSLHAPVKLEESRPLSGPHDENNTTKDYMKKYGIENCRGGVYTQRVLPDALITSLKAEFLGNDNKCMNCGGHGHFIASCKKTIKEECVWGCEYCDRTFTTRFGCSVHEKSCKEKAVEVKKEGRCFRCGRTGHYSPDCYASYHIKGYELD